MTREIVLDTETTGLEPRDGHRVIEIACVELINWLPTGRTFHCYINPERDNDPDAERVHGISREFLADKPVFTDAAIGPAFLQFVGEAALIAHNARFDREFLNHELRMAGLPELPPARWIDSLALAQQRYPGMYNSLDALCKRFKISLAEREKHGALIDTQLLAEVYLQLRGGREATLDLAPAVRTSNLTEKDADLAVTRGPRTRPRPLSSRLTAEERAAHEAFITGHLGAEPLWRRVLAGPAEG